MAGAGGFDRAEGTRRIAVVVGEAEVIHAFQAGGRRGASDALRAGDAGDE